MTDHSAGDDHFIARTALCLLPILLWAFHFGLVYGGAHVACAVGGAHVPECLADGLVIGASIIILSAIGGTGLASGYWLSHVADTSLTEPVFGFLNSVLRGLALVAFLGVLWATIATLFLPSCAAR